MLSSALRSQTKKLCKYWELLGIIGPSISPFSIIRVLKKLMKKWVLAYWLAAAITSEKIKSPSTSGNVGISENTCPRITFFFQMKATRDENPLQYERERIKAFKNQTPVGRGQGIVCVQIPAYEIIGERQTFRETGWASEKAFAHTFILVIKQSPFKKKLKSTQPVLVRV